MNKPTWENGFMRNITMVVAAAYFCSGCAGVTVHSLGSSSSADSQARGFRYWQTAPFLFVRSDGQGGLSGEIKWLPDTTQKMSARPFAIFSSNESKLDFTNGVLTSATIKANETEVVNASLTALSKVFVAAADGSAHTSGQAAPSARLQDRHRRGQDQPDRRCRKKHGWHYGRCHPCDSRERGQQ
ncbi:hypothetical protein P4124_08635 [Pseudomonas aeruginosa]|nr:hypothetical protein [Pseudomonas aeruginosa]